ncbi:MAG: hypothetical protein KatS3mg117_0045 [Geminicoccaceae bacterium]|nr:MAG: hypothetical protein KatS3mg117_0045 [Geminicoccaceae bacterium]
MAERRPPAVHTLTSAARPGHATRTPTAGAVRPATRSDTGSPTTRRPALVLGQGTSTLVVEEHPTARCPAGLLASLPRPRPILAISARVETEPQTLGAGDRPPTIDDVAAFPPVLRAFRCPAPGEPDLARQVAARREAEGFEVALDPTAGFDHGVGGPLAPARPAADLPVVRLPIVPTRDTEVAILGSGSLVHDPGAVRRNVNEPTLEATAFADALATALARSDRASLVAWHERLPFADRNHPTPEHLRPLPVAVGAGTPGHPGRRLHRSVAHRAFVVGSWALDRGGPAGELGASASWTDRCSRDTIGSAIHSAFHERLTRRYAAMSFALQLRIRGRVQGVGYRAWLVREADRRGVAGWVRNRRDGSVEALLAGDEATVRALVEACRRGPPAARVEAIETAAAEGADLDGFVALPTV